MCNGPVFRFCHRLTAAAGTFREAFGDGRSCFLLLGFCSAHWSDGDRRTEPQSGTPSRAVTGKLLGERVVAYCHADLCAVRESMCSTRARDEFEGEHSEASLEAVTALDFRTCRRGQHSQALVNCSISICRSDTKHRNRPAN